MIALPSIAFGGFSGSAKGVTARQVGGRSILSVKCWPTGAATGAQLIRRASLKKISKSWKELTSDQMHDWDRLAETATGQSVFGQAAQLSGMNLYVRLNANRAMAGESILHDAPEQLVFLPNVVYDKLWVTTKNIVIKGITHEAGYKLVIKMSATPSTSTVDIAADYAAKHGAPSAAAPKIFFRYYLVNGATGEKSGTILAECKWTAGE